LRKQSKAAVAASGCGSAPVSRSEARAVPAPRVRLWVLTLAFAAGVAACGSSGDEPPTAPPATIADGGTSATAEPGPAAATSGESVVSGTITYAQRISLPKDAVVDVRLYDVARTGSPAGLIAARRFAAGGQVPIRFELPYDSARLSDGGRYGIQARILVDGALWFINPDPVPIPGHGAPVGLNVRVRPASAKE